MKNVLLLGGTGAMGSFLADLLSNDYRVDVTTRKHRESKGNLTFIEGNAMSLNFLFYLIKSKHYDIIVDFMNYKTNDFRRRVGDLLTYTDHYVYLSSARVYANSNSALSENSPRLLDVSEDREFLETDDYALAKARQEDILFKSDKTNWTIIRPYMTYFRERLDLGFFTKEMWLYRVINGRSVLFSNRVKNKLTTLTYGLDVAKGIASLLDKEDAKGKVFHITQSNSRSWGDVISLYKNILEKRGYKFNVEFSDQLIEDGDYISKFDRMYDRVFDNKNISSFVDVDNFVDIEVGITECVNAFLSNMRFSSIDWNRQAYWDRILGERTHLKEIDGLKQKLFYLNFRYLIPYQFIYKLYMTLKKKFGKV